MTDRVRRVFHPGGGIEGERIVLDAEESHHLLRVLRARDGDPVEVFDGRGAAWSGTVEGSAGGAAILRVGAAIGGRTDPDFAVVIHQALCRPEKLEWVLQKGTEIGVAAFDLLAAARADAAAPSATRIDRYRRVLVEACKQSGRRRVPSLSGPSPIPGPPGPGASGVVLDLDARAAPLAAILEGPRPVALHLAVGPEGGFTREEVDVMEATGWRAAGLGPRTLRTETAGVIAAALALHRWADLAT